MYYSVLRLRDVRMAVVLVEGWQLQDHSLIPQLQQQLALPVMLVAKNNATLKGAEARAQFDAEPYLFSLLALDDVEWCELPAQKETELPF